ncbi:MAG: hypothetical protein H0U67_02445, partial [Gemmatimonadetes bacterium]|nr:hypothetical protein [Gemmatimonadota bacterium]
MRLGTFGHFVVALLGVVLSGILQVQAQTAPPSPAEVLGYSLGEHFSDAAEVHRYSRMLAELSSRVNYRQYGVTPERRPLYQLVIAREDHL